MKASYLIFLKAYVVKLKRNHIGTWGSGASDIGIWGPGVKITKASYQIIKWYVPKKKASYLIFYESLCSEIGKKLHILMKAYAVKLERNHIGIWGSGGDSPQKPGTFQRMR